MNIYAQNTLSKEKGIKYYFISKKYPLRIQQYSPSKVDIYHKPSKPVNINNYKKITNNILNKIDSNLKKQRIKYRNNLDNCKKNACYFLTSNFSNSKGNKAKQHYKCSSVDKENRLSPLRTKYKNLNNLTQNDISIYQSNINKNRNAIDEILAKISKLKENLKNCCNHSNKNSSRKINVQKETKKNNIQSNISINSDDCNNRSNIVTNRVTSANSENRKIKKDINLSNDIPKNNSIGYDYLDYDKLLQNEIAQKDKDFYNALSKLIIENKKLKNIIASSTLNQESNKRNVFTDRENDIEEKKKGLLRRLFKEKHNKIINILHIKLLEYYYKIKCENSIVNRFKNLDIQKTNNDLIISKSNRISYNKNNLNDNNNQNINNELNKNNDINNTNINNDNIMNNKIDQNSNVDQNTQKSNCKNNIDYINPNNNQQDINANDNHDNKNKQTANTNNINNETNIVDAKPNNQNNINNENENQTNNEETKEKDKEKPKNDPEYKKRIEKSRKLRKLLAEKEKNRKETLSKNFEIFLLNGLYMKVRAETEFLKKRLKINEDQMKIIKRQLSFDPQKLLDSNNQNLEKNKIENENQQKRQELLLSIFNKKDKKITGILRSKFEDYNIRAKIESLKKYEKKKKTKKKSKKKTKKSENKNTDGNNDLKQ